jgi:hypothetical protein
MSGHLQNIHDPRMARQYREAVRRRLRHELSIDEFDVMHVSSYSRPHHWHRVERVDDSHVRCSCETVEGLCCSHASIAIAHFFPVVWLRWFTEESTNTLQLLSKIRTGEELTRSEKLKVCKGRRLYHESHSEVRMAA